MNRYSWLSILSILAAVSGCSNIERSRDLTNPNVRPAVTAMQVCSTCHGVDGNSVSPNFPRLAGQPAAYLVAQLEIFRSHQRADPAGFEYMWGISHRLTDAQISGLAEYFSAQLPASNAAVDPAQMAQGKLIFDNGLPAKEAPPCMACHGPKGEGMASFPRLANQHQDYLIKQLSVFQRTDERPGTPMTQIAHLLSPQEMAAVAGYLQAMPNDR